jgi:hypothetical protein
MSVSSGRPCRGRVLSWSMVSGIVIVRLAAVFFIPFGQHEEHLLEGLNDEPAHYNYVKYLAQHRALPVLEHDVREQDAFVRNEYEYFQAPLYYLLCAPLYGLSGGTGALTACRLLSMLSGIAGLLIIALILRDCGLPLRVRQGAVLFVGLLPSHLYFTSLVSNDALSWLFALLMTREMLRYGTLAEGHPAAVRTVAMAALYGAAGALTKGSLLIMFPAAAGVFIYRYYISKNRLHLVRGGIALGVAAAAAAPWYIRNVLLYHSLLGTPSAAGEAFFTAQGIYAFVKMTVKYFWFPMQHLEGGTAAYAALCALGAVVIAAHALAALTFYIREARRDFTATAMLLFFLLNAAAYVWYYFFAEWGSNAEARFLFPALASIAYFFIVPAHRIFSHANLERLFFPYILLISLFPYPFLLFAG